MAELKEPAHNSLWYASPVQMPASRSSHAVDAGLSNPTSASPHSGRPRQGGWGSVDHHQQYPSYSRYSQDDTNDPYDRHQHPSLPSHQSFPNLKRPYSATEQPPYQEIVQDLRDDGSKLGVGHDHKLLSFRKVPDKHTILDHHGRMQQLELTAQLHGMFFLSEMPTTNNDGSVMQPELTCYRRNLFQVSGSLITPRGQLSVITETGETAPVSSTEVTISSIESVDGHPVRLIVIPWKTPPPNSPEVTQAPDQEPASLPLIPFQDDGSDADGEYAVYPIGWRRLQFRIATANNGRRKELQQHFVVHLKVMGTLANGTKVVLTEAATAPIVVRGRSPRNFQARKEIPLLGSSAGSRGQALVETGLGIVAGPLAIKPQEVKARPLNMELPRTAFTFNAPKLPASPMTSMRSNSYPTTWNPSMPSSGATNYPATTIASDPYQKMPLSGASAYSGEPQDMQSHIPTSMPSMQLSMVSSDQPGQQQQQQSAASHQVPPIRTQYASYVQSSNAPPPLSVSSTANSSLSVPRYVDDSNPRPTKSPRHPSIHAGSISSTESSGEYRYGPPYSAMSTNSAEISPQTSQHASYSTSHGGGGHETSAGANTQSSSTIPPPRDYFPPSTSWTTTAGESNAPTYTNGDHRSSYPYSADQYKTAGGVKSDPHAPPPPVYPGQAMSHYSWNTS
ncbi:NDT80/PhoG like DNA-binding family protein [Diaporthe eres]|nr:NDT80/PhoG like DNA-binding family protein [Diaporthe eres]